MQRWFPDSETRQIKIHRSTSSAVEIAGLKPCLCEALLRSTCQTQRLKDVQRSPRTAYAYCSGWVVYGGCAAKSVFFHRDRLLPVPNAANDPRQAKAGDIGGRELAT